MISRKGEFKNIIELTENFRAPREKVYRVWTQADHLRNWFMADEGRTVSTAVVDLRVDGAYKIGISPTNSDQETIIEGTFKKIITSVELEYSWRVEIMEPEDNTYVTVQFKNKNHGSEIFLTHGVFKDENMAEIHAQGWEGCVTILKRYLEKCIGLRIFF